MAWIADKCLTSCDILSSAPSTHMEISAYQHQMPKILLRMYDWAILMSSYMSLLLGIYAALKKKQINLFIFQSSQFISFSPVTFYELFCGFSIAIDTIFSIYNIYRPHNNYICFRSLSYWIDEYVNKYNFCEVYQAFETRTIERECVERTREWETRWETEWE